MIHEEKDVIQEFEYAGIPYRYRVHLTHRNWHLFGEPEPRPETVWIAMSENGLVSSNESEQSALMDLAVLQKSYLGKYGHPHSGRSAWGPHNTTG